MKKLLFFSIITLFYSCKNSENKETTTQSKNEINLENSVWVNENYLNSLQKTKSAQKSSMFADTAMVVFNAKADTATFTWNFHESSNYRVAKNEKIQFFSVDEIKPNPDFEAIFENGKLNFGKSNFVKTENDKIAERIILAGKYVKDGKEIELTKDGKVIGIDTLASYYVPADYVTESTEIDAMDFISKSGNYSSFGFQFEGNDSVFYEMIWKEENEGKKGKERFRFHKK